MNHSDAVQALVTIHTTVSPMVIGLAQDRDLSRSDLLAIRRLPSVAREALLALELPEPKVQRVTEPAPEGQASRCLSALLVRTSELLGDCARLPLPHALDNATQLHTVHFLTWGLVHALGLEGT